jgi:pimeloyl-ACP methyl ester carboxylesterase
MEDFAWVSWDAADGTRLAARDYPAVGPERGAPVLCLHGLTRNSRDFEAVAPWIAGQGRRVIVPDVRGRGRSGYAADPQSYHPGVYVADLLALLDKLEIGKVVAVGTSMGGLIAMVFSAMAPERLAGAALNDVGPQISPVGLARIGGYAGRTADVADWAGAAAYAKAINGVAFPGYGEADWMAFARRIYRDGERGPVLDYDPGIITPMAQPEGGLAPQPDLWPLFERLAEGGRPLLLIRGAISDLIEPEVAAEMRRRAPQMRYAEVAGVGHAPMLIEPEAKAALAEFLARAP